MEVFCNISLSEKLKITFMNITQVSYVSRHLQLYFGTGLSQDRAVQFGISIMDLGQS